MKAKIAAILLALSCSAQAHLIELTPGGFNLFNPPPVFIDWEQNHFDQDSFGIAFANVDGWVPGFLGPPLFNVTPLGGATATLSWNLTGTPFIFNYLFVGTGPDGWKNMYQVSLDQQKVGEGVITINGLFDITQIGIYGFPSLRGVPDSGSAILMFGLSAGVLIALAARYRSRPFVAVSWRV